PLTFGEEAKNFVRQRVENLPALGTAVGEMLAGPPGAATGAVVGAGLRQAGRSAGYGIEKPAENTGNELADAAISGVGSALVGAGINQLVRPISTTAAMEARNESLSKIYNKLADVPAGRRGVRASMETGEITTNPGQAMVRANEEQRG